MQRILIARWQMMAVLAATWLLSAAVRAQEPVVEPAVEPSDPDPVVEERIDALEDAWKDRRQTRDAEATEVIQELTARLDQPLHPKDRKAIRTVFTRVLMTGRLRAPDAIEPYRAVTDGLSHLGDDGVDVLIAAYEKKRFPRHEEWAPMREVLIDAIGATGSEDAIPFLVERVQRSGENGELRAGGAAMARFAAADQKQRKAMVEILARRLAGFESEASAPAVNQDQQLNMNRENAVRMLRAVAGPWKATLQKLTGESIDSGADWQSWYQENKRKDWPAREPDRGS